MSESGPLHLLDSAKGGNVLVKLKPTGDREDVAVVSGTLKAYDLHLNMFLEDATVEENETKTQYGELLIRGDNIIFVSPE